MINVKIDVLNERKNILLGRHELLLRIESGGPTPSEKSIAQEIAKMFKTKEDFVLIEDLHQKYGKQIIEVKAEIYDKPVAKKKKRKVGESGEAEEAGKEVSKNAEETSKEG